MSFRATEILGRSAAIQVFDWTERDYLIYALALGLGSDPTAAASLAFVYERGLKIVPTLPTILAWLIEPTFASLGAGVDFALHAGQVIQVHRPLPGPARVAVSGRVVAVHDKGPERGALIVMRQEVTDAAQGVALATLTTTCFARDCGGCGSGGEAAVTPHALPARTPDQVIRYAVSPQSALLYRLTGDRNPLHADPQAAHAAGFPSPILHGLCTFGMTCRAVLEGMAGWQPERLASHEGRFTAPVFPGDTLEIALWQDGGTVSFQASVPERGVTVITNGKALLR